MSTRTAIRLETGFSLCYHSKTPRAVTYYTSDKPVLDTDHQLTTLMRNTPINIKLPQYPFRPQRTLYGTINLRSPHATLPPRPKMSMSSSSANQPMISLSSLTFLTPQKLATSLKNPSSSSSSPSPSPTRPAIIDVRDNDHLGGHIRTSQWIPITQLDARMPELLRVNDKKDRVVFHCMLSQQRGPKAALAYARARAVKVAKEQKEQDGESEESVVTVDGEGRTTVGGQEICVLQGGFEGWRLAGFAEDEVLTEGYVRDLWE